MAFQVLLLLSRPLTLLTSPALPHSHPQLLPTRGVLGERGLASVCLSFRVPADSPCMLASLPRGSNLSPHLFVFLSHSLFACFIFRAIEIP